MAALDWLVKKCLSEEKVYLNWDLRDVKEPHRSVAKVNQKQGPGDANALDESLPGTVE